MALKGLGLSFARIRAALSSPSPLALREVLHMQLDVWRKHRIAADEGASLVQMALANLDGHELLSIDDLCQLTRGLEMHNLQAIRREAWSQPTTQRGTTTRRSTAAPSRRAACVAPYHRCIRRARCAGGVRLGGRKASSRCGDGGIHGGRVARAARQLSHAVCHRRCDRCDGSVPRIAQSAPR